MERISIVGGLKTEPLEIGYELPANGTSVEISVDDIYSDNDDCEEKKGMGFKDTGSGSGLGVSRLECRVISEVSEDKMGTSRQMFNYIGFSKEDKTKKINLQREKYIFNYTGNHNLLIDNKFMPKIESEVTHEYGQLHEELLIESTSCNDVDNGINSDSAQNNDSVHEIMKHSTTFQNKENRSKNLDEAVLKDKSPGYIESTSDNDVNNEINSDSEQNDYSVDTIMNHSTTTGHKNEKKRNKQIYPAESVIKDKSPEGNDIPKKFCNLKITESSSENDGNNEIDSDSKQNDQPVDTIMNHSTTTVQNNEKRTNKQICLAERVFKDKSPEGNDIPKKPCNLKIMESSSDNDVNNEINSDNEENDRSVDTIMNHSTTTVQNNDKRSDEQIYLAEAVFKDDLSCKEYQVTRGGYICKHCRHKDRLQNIKNHIIQKHRKTETKQCPFCNVKTKVLAYHTRMYHKNMDRIPECNDISKKSCKLEIIESDNGVNNEINSDCEQNGHSIDTITTITVQKKDKRSNRLKIFLAEAVCKDDLSSREYHVSRGRCKCLHCGRQDTLQNIKNHVIARHRKTETKQCPSCNVKTKVLAYHIRLYHKSLNWPPECRKRSQKSCELDIIESTSGNEANNEINSDSEQNDHSVDTIMNHSTTTVQNNEKRSGKYINLAEAIFKDDLSSKEYTETNGLYVCKHCRHKDTLQNIKNHIIATHRKTETKQCPFCKVETKVLAYHIKMYHKDMHRSPESPECNDIPKKSCKLESIESTSDNDVNNEINSDSEQNDHSVDTIKNNSTTTVQNNEKRRNWKINLAEAVFKDDVSYKEHFTRRGRHVCLHCRHETTLKNIKNHIIENHRKTEEKQCHFCNVKTKVLAYHLRTYHKNMHKCPECNFIAKMSHKLKIHIRQRHRVNLTKCDKCGKIFTSKYHLYNHDLLIHRNLRRYYCASCDYSTTIRQNWRSHVQTHRDPQELPTLLCEQCDYRTKNPSTFVNHKNTHKKKLVCDQCGYSTGIVQLLKLHIISHKKQPDADDLRYRCDKCDYKTHRLYSFNVHKMKHLKPEEIDYFYCYHCNFKAKRKDNLKSHIFKMHIKKETLTLKCSICAFTTTKKHLLVQHVDKHSKNVH